MWHGQGEWVGCREYCFELQAKRGDKFLCFTLFLIQRIGHISAARCVIEIGFGSKCSIFIGQVIYTEKSKLNIADMWLIPLDHVTYIKNE